MNKENRYSPDVALYLLRKSEAVPLASIPCTSTLYNWIDQRFLQTKNMDLLLKTRRSPKKKRVRKNKTLLGLSIEKRPTEVDKREVFGHWEIDTVIGTKEADEPVLLTLIERKTRFELILKPTSKQASTINHELEGLKRKLGSSFSQIFRSITSDNGSEFAGLMKCLSPNTPVYFTHPYSSWERGSNENHNGVIRRFIPKGEPIRQFSLSTIRRVQQWMNDLPRKILNYATPHEAFVKELQQLEVSKIAI